jgi:hypothetical protein
VDGTAEVEQRSGERAVTDQEGGEAQQAGERRLSGEHQQQRGERSADARLRDGEEVDERPVRRFGLELLRRRLAEVERQVGGQRDARRRERQVRGRHAGCVGGVDRFAPLRDVHLLDLDRLHRTGLHAGGQAARAHAIDAQVALGDDAPGGVVLRHAVGAVPRAVLAADAGVGVVLDDAVVELGVRAGRAALEARGLEAVIAGHRQVEAAHVREAAALDLTDSAPGDLRLVAVLLVARDLAAAAADAAGHVEVEAELLAGRERR